MVGECLFCGFPLDWGRHGELRGDDVVCTVDVVCQMPARGVRLDGITSGDDHDLARFEGEGGLAL